MRIKIYSNIPPLEEQHLVTGEVIIDTRYVGAEQLAVRIINDFKGMEFDYDHLTLTDFLDAIHNKPKQIKGVGIEWDI